MSKKLKTEADYEKMMILVNEPGKGDVFFTDSAVPKELQGAFQWTYVAGQFTWATELPLNLNQIHLIKILIMGMVETGVPEVAIEIT